VSSNFSAELSSFFDPVGAVGEVEAVGAVGMWTVQGVHRTVGGDIGEDLVREAEVFARARGVIEEEEEEGEDRQRGQEAGPPRAAEDGPPHQNGLKETPDLLVEKRKAVLHQGQKAE